MDIVTILAIISAVATAMPEILKFIQALVALFKGTSQPVSVGGKMTAGPPSQAPEDALRNFFYYVRVAAAACKSVDKLDFGKGVEGNKDARFDTVMEQIRQHAIDLNDPKNKGQLMGIVWAGWMLMRTGV